MGGCDSCKREDVEEEDELSVIVLRKRKRAGLAQRRVETGHRGKLVKCRRPASDCASATLTEPAARGQDN